MTGVAMNGADMMGQAERRTIVRSVRRTARIGFGLLALMFVYLTYTWFAFDVPTLIDSAKPERAALLATDSVAYKVHVTRMLRRGTTAIAVEGERTATYSTPPDWIATDGDVLTVDLDDGYVARVFPTSVILDVPNYGSIRIAVQDGRVITDLPPGNRPDWLRVNDVKFDARPDLKRRVQVSRAKIEVHRYFLGWENFFFPFNSPLKAYSFGELLSLTFSAARLDPEVANWHLIYRTFWENPDWQHGNVFVALLETLLMAVLGTFTAALVALPLAFLAARNFTPSRTLRFFVRRLFDFVRGIDMLIWSLIFIRAFGLGPLTGALAIAFTDTGTLGKLFSEALENTDRKQVEGVSATGASKLQIYRYGVIPQILPIFISQGFYYLESNTRSATVIGALGAGGIGLMLVETIRTSRDWENTLYIILLTILLVIAMDAVSMRVRRRLTGGTTPP
ncbi:MAG: phosphonate ABC transporter, permease protein PhnE [Minwuia sp.]|nr:phosphonate ABC transporter, permease protein PhnE [Minwuia sp.]